VKKVISRENAQVAFRATPSMIERLDRLADAMAAGDGGINPGRSMAIRQLVLTALPLLESQHGVERKAS
jgi:hypothetical protein